MGYAATSTILFIVVGLLAASCSGESDGLPPLDSLAAPPGDVKEALERLASAGVLEPGAEGPLADHFEMLRTGSCASVSFRPDRGVFDFVEWEMPDGSSSSHGGRGWSAGRLVEKLKPRMKALLRPLPPSERLSPTELLASLGRPDRVSYEPRHVTRGGPIFPGGPSFSEVREVEDGRYAICHYDAPGLTVRSIEGKVLRMRVDLRVLDAPPIEEVVPGIWSIDRQAYTEMVDDLVSVKYGNRWDAEHARMKAGTDRVELRLTLAAGGTGTLRRRDFAWVSHPRGFRVGWSPGPPVEEPIRWHAAPGGLRVLLSNRLSPSHPRKIDFLYFDESLIVLTTHPRELRLERE